MGICTFRDPDHTGDSVTTFDLSDAEQFADCDARLKELMFGDRKLVAMKSTGEGTHAKIRGIGDLDPAKDETVKFQRQLVGG